MNKERAKKLLPLIKAFAEGKEIEYQNRLDDVWQLTYHPEFDDEDISRYRIKQEPTYRPFENEEECWQEMQKHQPFGWVKQKDDEEDWWYSSIVDVMSHTVFFCDRDSVNFGDAIEKFTFADGTPFGKLTEDCV